MSHHLQYEYNGKDDENNQNLDEVADYKTTKSLFLYQSVCAGNIPSNTKKFENLTSLKIDGARMWELTLDNVPSTVTHLEIEMPVNCPYVPDLLHKAPHLNQLQWLRFYFDEHATHPLPNLPSLKDIEVVVNYDDEDECFAEIETKVVKSEMFNLIASRVKSVERVGLNCIKIKLV